jgi:hypothetical protein
VSLKSLQNLFRNVYFEQNVQYLRSLIESGALERDKIYSASLAGTPLPSNERPQAWKVSFSFSLFSLSESMQEQILREFLGREDSAAA